MKIAVLGGSFFQADFVYCAVEKGFTVFVLDMDPACYLNDGSGWTFVNLNFADEELVFNFCKREVIDFVFAPANELGNIVAARLASKIGYQYNSEEVVISTIDKSIQREILNKQTAVKSPKNKVFDNNLDEIINVLEFPMVVKPSNSSAGRGVTGVNNRKELKNAIADAQQFLKPNGKILVEEYLEGVQLSVETLSVDSKHLILGITKEIVTGAPLFIERCHFMSKEIHNKYYPIIKGPISDLLDAFHLKWGPCHIEIKVSEKGVGLLEIASRTGGLRDRLMKNAGYPDYNSLILDAYFQKEIKEEKINVPTSNALVNILVHPDDLNTIEAGKIDKTWHSDYFNGKAPSPNPQNIIDAYGYAYFKSKHDLSKYSLS